MTDFPAVIDLSTLAVGDGSTGFVLNGTDANDNSGFSVSSAGDVNGDGLDDIVIGARGADPSGDSDAGESYVVFGSAAPSASLDLSSLNGSNGFRLDGIDASDRSGFSVSSAGDVNGDGYDDIIIGADRADPSGGSLAGESYVVFGTAAPSASVDLSSLDGSNGFRLDGIDATDYSGRSVSSAGDVNGDGFDDILVGAAYADLSGGNFAGESYVVFGSATPFSASLGLSALDGTTGFRLDGIDGGDRSGRSVSSAGDVNGDGIDDILIGARTADANGAIDAGESYVVFGSASPSASLDLSTLDGSNGFRLDGINAFDNSGFSVSSAGDVNGDGFDDVIIGAYLSDANGSRSGESYVVFGSATPSASLDLSSLDGSNGLRIAGIDGNDLAGFSVSSAGDVNGDGFDDIIIGAYGGDPNGDSYAGETYVVLGTATPFSASLDLSSLDGSNGFRLDGIDPFDQSGRSVSSAGDVNGDGVDDIIIGAYRADPNGDNSGESYVVFGRQAEVAPVAQDDAFTTDENTVVAGNFITNTNPNGTDSDANGDTLTISSVMVGGQTVDVGVETTLSSGALLRVQTNGDFTYDPNGAFMALANGESDLETITYEITDGNVTQSPGIFSGTLGLASLDGSNGFTLNGVTASDYSGASVSSAGDVNGDGIDDFIIGASGADPNGNNLSGESYVVFGSASGFSAGFELSTLASGDGSTGFVLNGVDEIDQSGRSVSSAGDINGDGIDDIIIGANTAGLNSNIVGASYVVFGTASGFSAEFELSSLASGDGSTGFVLNGIDASDYSGISVSSAGDMNGDGIDDIIIGAYGADPNGSRSGESYVVFGSASGFSAEFELSTLASGDGSTGFVLNGISADDLSGRSVASAGDINGDGLGDLVIGATNVDINGTDAGASYVVFGSASGFSAEFELSSLAAGDGSTGFVLDGVDSGDGSGRSVSSAGDVNGDGIDDIIIGAHLADPDTVRTGQSFVVFGSASGFGAEFDLSSLDGNNGFTLNGIDEDDETGLSVASAGDVNADGNDDLIVSAPFANGPSFGDFSFGESYVVFGSNTGFSAEFELSTLEPGDGSTGFAIKGIGDGDISGRSVSSAGDVNGDGIDDLIIGADGGDPNGSRSGESYVIFGRANIASAVDTGIASFTIEGTDDDIFFGTSGIDTFDGGVGFNQISYENSASGITFDFVTPANNSGDAAGDVLTNFAGVIGTSQTDILTGDSNANRIDGGAGSDTLDGGGGIDAVSYLDRTEDVAANLGSGVALIAGVETDTLISIENFTGGSGNDRVFGSTVANVLTGGAGGDLLAGLDGEDELFGGLNNDSLSGGAGDDMLDGGTGDDRLFGNNDNDTINGGAGDDFVNGGNGDDTIFGGDDGDSALVGGNDNDEIHGGGGSDGLNGSAGDDELFGDEGDDRLFGGTGNDELFGGVDDDMLGGLGDMDMLFGGSGEDGLNGGGGNDVLNGEAGVDRLFGGSGDDTLTGGSEDDLIFGQVGLDTYVFEANWGNDLVVRYGDVNGGTSARVDEIIDLSALGVTFADVNVAQDGNSTLITVDGHAGNSIELNFTNMSTITESDFNFIM